MLGRKKHEKVIDAIAEIDRKQSQAARGASSLGSRQHTAPAGARTFLWIVITCAVLLMGVVTWKSLHAQSNMQATVLDTKKDTVRNTLPPLKPLALKTEELSEQSSVIQVPKEQKSAEPSLEDQVRMRRLSSHLIAEETKTSSPSNRSSAAMSYVPSIRESNSSSSGLQNRLQPLRLTPSKATTLGDRNYILTQGAMLDCQLETMLITTQPGMTSCYVTRDIYSANGHVVLIDRGSKIVGHYQGGMTQGQARIFILWSRIETPQGVVINIDSPGTGALGEAGVGGVIDTHFFERFGGAIMISLVGDLGQYVANQGQHQNNGNTLQFTNTVEGTQQAVAEVLRNSITIPPTLYKNQGERISIFVARDLDFGDVYALEHSN